MIRAAIIDDSATMRSLIAAALRADPDIDVVGFAADPIEARAMIKSVNPDVITLDVEMPNMSGLDFLQRLMRLRPMPVVMVSTLTQRGAETTLEALELGAVDCIAKPSSGAGGDFRRLVDVVKAAAHARVRPRTASTHGSEETANEFSSNGKIVAIGASTGGVEALLALVEKLPPNCAPTVITQHMPAAFTRSFAARMNRTSAAEVTEAWDGAPLSPGKIYLAPGGETHLRVNGAGSFHCRVERGEPVNGHRPSVDVLFSSVAAAAKNRAVGALLTGMGRDGAKGLLEMRQAGARTLGQDDATSVVYGMPKVAFEIGATECQLPLEMIAGAIKRLTNRLERR